MNRLAETSIHARPLRDPLRRPLGRGVDVRGVRPQRLAGRGAPPPAAPRLRRRRHHVAGAEHVGGAPCGAPRPRPARGHAARPRGRSRSGPVSRTSRQTVTADIRGPVLGMGVPGPRVAAAPADAHDPRRPGRPAGRSAPTPRSRCRRSRAPRHRRARRPARRAAGRAPCPGWPGTGRARRRPRLRGRPGDSRSAPAAGGPPRRPGAAVLAARRPAADR